MKYLLHGDDTVSSRKFISSLLEGHMTTNIEGKSLAPKDLETHLLSTGLFGDKKALVIENLLSRNARKKELMAILNTHTGSVLPVLWEDKKLTKTSLNTVKGFEIKEFVLPSVYFQFLDNFTQKNGKKLFIMYQDLLKTVTAEQIFYSLLKRMRLLLVLSGNGRSDELLKMSPWQKQKLQQQARFWDTNALFTIYKELTDTEIKLKSGRLPLGLSKHLDTLILSQL